MPNPPDLDDENVDAWDLWLACQTQWRVSFSGVVGLDYNALYRVAETLEIEITSILLHKIQALEHEVTSGDRHKRDPAGPGEPPKKPKARKAKVR